MLIWQDVALLYVYDGTGYVRICDTVPRWWYEDLMIVQYGELTICCDCEIIIRWRCNAMIRECDAMLVCDDE